MVIPDNEVLNNLVSRVFRIEDVTLGEPARGMVARYRGHLLSEDSVSAYDTLAASLKPYGITPLFRMDRGQQVVYLAPSRPDPKPARVSINVILFLLTVLSVMLVGGSAPAGAPPADIAGQALYYLQALLSGWPYALSLMSMLSSLQSGTEFLREPLNIWLQ